MSLYQFPPIFDESMTREDRAEVIRDIAEQAEATFQREYFKINEWFHQYDALYLLAYCAAYFLAHPEGIDPEAQGSLDFYPHYLEILQAFSLMQERSFLSKPLAERAEDLLDLMENVGNAISLRGMVNPGDLTDEELHQRQVLLNIRAQTAAVRNWAHPPHMRRVIHALGETVRQDFISLYGVDPIGFMDALLRLSETADQRLNQHIGQIRHFYQQSSYQRVASSYVESFPEVCDFDADRIFEIAGRNLESLKVLLVQHADFRLVDSLTFTLEDIAGAYGEEVDLKALTHLLDMLAIEFGDLRDQDKEHVILDNPVWSKPFIKVDQETYFSAVIGLMPHYIQGLLDSLVSADPGLKQRYHLQKARYLEDEIENLFRESFPGGKIYRGSMWEDGFGANGENDLTVIVGCVAFVVEAKSGLIPPSAGRGAPERFRWTVKQLVDEPAEQADRFVRVLKSLQTPGAFQTKDGSVNTLDPGGVRYFIPLTITLEQFGLVSNLRQLVESGISMKQFPEIASVISLTDLMMIFEILDLQSEKVHYLARRREFDAHVLWHGTESDILAFYLDNGFNIGEAEYSGEHRLVLTLSSKRLDPYFHGQAAGVPTPKPGLTLTPWWKAMLQRLDGGPTQQWLEAALLLLNVPYTDQQKVERQFDKLRGRVWGGKLKMPHNWIILITEPPQRRFFLAVYPYMGIQRDLRNSIIDEILNSTEAEESRGAICIGIDLEQDDVPYSVAAFRQTSELFDQLQPAEPDS